MLVMMTSGRGSSWMISFVNLEAFSKCSAVLVLLDPSFIMYPNVKNIAEPKLHTSAGARGRQRRTVPTHALPRNGYLKCHKERKKEHLLLLSRPCSKHRKVIEQRLENPS
jgi:hypothetical protein